MVSRPATDADGAGKSSKANGTDKAYLYLWIVPSVVAGSWRMELDLGGGKQQMVVLTFDQRYQRLTSAWADYGLGAMKNRRAIVARNEISFNLTIGANPYQFTGNINDGKMEGTAVTPGNSRLTPWRAGSCR